MARKWSWIAARRAGTSHERAGTPVQDAFSAKSCAVLGKEIFFCVVSDGAGSASFGQKGASLACRIFGASLREWIRKEGRLPDEPMLNACLDATRDAIYIASKKRGLAPRDFAATIVTVASDGFNTIAFHVGDGGAAIRTASRGDWESLSWPSHGEYASSTNFITDEPEVQYYFEAHLGEVDSIAVFTDGLERLALDFKSHRPHPGFFNAFSTPLFKTSAFGKRRDLSLKLYELFGSSQINSRTDDDKTLVVAVR